jgi:hypothetical protein
MIKSENRNLVLHLAWNEARGKYVATVTDKDGDDPTGSWGDFEIFGEGDNWTETLAAVQAKLAALYDFALLTRPEWRE